MGAVIPNLEEVFTKITKDLAALEARMGSRIKSLILDADTHLKALTPVYSGSAVRNYIWTVGEPNSVTYEAIADGPTGRTNSMALGQEPRRAANESAALESLLAIDLTNPFQTFYCTNLSPDIEGLELGLLPGPPLSSRSPNGMFGITQAYVEAKIASKGITS